MELKSPKGTLKDFKHLFGKQINVVFREHFPKTMEGFPRASLLSFEMYF